MLRSVRARGWWLGTVLMLAGCGGGPVAEDGGRDASSESDASGGCTSAAECPSGVCGADGICAPPACDDSVQNGDETDADCGGSCDPCEEGSACTLDADCTSGRCADGSCAPPLLATGEVCTGDDECASGTCRTFGDASICTETCETTCPGEMLACFEGFCTPRDYCVDPDGDGFGEGPGCTGTICDSCAATATCAELPDGGFECNCNSGYSGDGRTCADVDECTDATDTCDANAACTNTDGAFTCACVAGYSGDGMSCADDDECTDGTDTCDANAACTNTDGGFTCACNAGYGGDGMSCTDDDECMLGTDTCDTNASCTNIGGGFTCACNAGYSGTGMSCTDDDECTLGTDTCDTNASCTNIDGGFTCACNAGYSGSGMTCTDDDECTLGTDTCDANASCTNTAGSFTCACNAGYSGTGMSCTDDDECTLGTDTCDANASCTNTAGSFTCACNAGYSGSGMSCTDDDECTLGTDDCDPLATCTNTPGSFTCACPADAVGDGRTCTYFASCRALLLARPSTPTGDYTIDTGTGGPVLVHCDMDSDGGAGYTMVRFDDGSLTGAQSDYRAFCAARGMEVIVPRTRAHASAIRTWNGGDPPNLVNVFPEVDGATGLNNWEGRCGGAPCDFWLSNSNNAGCLGFEPNGDNNTGDALYLVDGGACDYGHWNDANGAMSVTGHVICSTNDAGPAPLASCLETLTRDSVQNVGPTGISGVYDLESGGTAYRAYCDMTSDGGGWTLVLKADGRLATFGYDSPLWTGTSTLNPAQADFDQNEALLDSYFLVPFTSVRVGMQDPIAGGAVRYVTLDHAASSLSSVIGPGTYTPTAIGRDAWKGMMASGSLQPNCNREGFNATHPTDGDPAWARARIGIVANQEADCGSPDSRIGIGTQGTACGMSDAISVGNAAFCSADAGDRNTQAFGYVLVR